MPIQVHVVWRDSIILKHDNHTPGPRNIVSSLKKVRICVMPCPPDQLNPKDVVGNVQDKDSYGHSKGLKEKAKSES